jgi:hypothetical protein
VSFATKDPDGARSLCYVTGLTSSGKTTLLELLRPTLEPFGCRLLDFSSLLMRELGPPSGWETLELSKFAGAATRCAEELVSETPVVVAGHVFTRFAGQRIVLEGAWRTILPCSAVVFLAILCVPNSDVDREFWLTLSPRWCSLDFGPHLAPTLDA